MPVLRPLIARCFVGIDAGATHTFETCPRLDLICVPGGNAGVVQAMGKGETIAFVQRQASDAKYVTSVCNCALILGAAGLLRGRKWRVRECEIEQEALRDYIKTA